MTAKFHICLCFGMFVNTVFAQNINPACIVAQYPFTGNTNDVSGNNFHGTPHGGLKLTTDRKGNVNNAYDFDGVDDYIDCGYHSEMNMYQSDFSIAVWIYLREYGNLNKVIFSNRVDAQPLGGALLSVFGQDTPDPFHLAFSSFGGTATNFATSGSIISLNKWYFVVLTVDYTGTGYDNVTIYIDGQLDKQTTLKSMGNPLNQKAFIGYEPMSVPTTYYFNGVIDNFTFYKCALSDTDVSDLYNENTSPCIVAQYPFTGNTNDVSGNNFNGTPRGGIQLTTDRLGNPNSAYEFDGIDDYIDCGYHSEMSTYQQDFSISVWIYLKQYGSLASVISSNRLAGTPVGGSSWGVAGTNNSQYKKIAFTSRSGNDASYVTSNTAIELNTWYFVVVAFDYTGTQSENVSLYINGKLDNRAAMKPVIDHKQQPTYIGYEPVTVLNDYHFNGIIDEYTFYKCLLSDTDVSDLYNENASPCIVAQYPFTGNTNDVSGNNFHGTPQGGIQLTTDRLGNPNSAYQFDGIDDYIDCGYHSEMSTYQQDFAISTWIYMSKYSDLNNIIFSNRKGTSPVGGAIFTVYGSSTQNPKKLAFQSYGGESASYATSATEILLNQWYFVAVTVDYTGTGIDNIKLYINGKLDAYGTINSMSSSQPQPAYIGYEPMTVPDNYHFTGKIDDFTFHKCFLSDSDVNDLYNENASPCIVAQYPFTGNTNDVSGNNFHGTPQGGIQLTTDRLGNANSAYQFDGIDDYIDFGYHPEMNVYQTDFSMSGWIYLTEYAYTTSVIFSNRLQGLPVGGVLFSVGGLSTAGARKLAFASLGGVNITSAYSSADILLNRWYFVSLTVNYTPNNQQLAKLYIDGKYDSESLIAPIAYNNKQPAYIGYEPFNPPSDYHFKGKIDDFTFYKCELTESDINDIYTESDVAQVAIQGTCSNSNVAFNFSANYTPDNVEWNFGDGSAIIKGNNVTHRYTNAGNYNVTATVYRSCCQPEIIQRTITILPNPDVNLGADRSICNTENITLGAIVEGATYQWDNGVTAATRVVNNAGTYWVRVQNQCGTDTDTIVIKQNTLPKINLGNDTTVCYGANIVLNVTQNNASYLWNNGATNPIQQINKAGTYWVRVQNECGIDYDTIVIKTAEQPTVNLGNDTTLCAGVAMALDAYNPQSQYLWSNGSSAPDILVTQKGRYWVRVVNACGVKRDTIFIDYVTPATIGLGDDTTICVGDSLMLTVTDPQATYQWSNGSTQNYIHIKNAGTYWVKASIKDCVTSDTITITQINMPTLNMAKQMIVCENKTLSIQANVSQASLLWDNGAITLVRIVNTAGTYWVKAYNQCGTDVDTINVDLMKNPYVNLGQDTVICQGAVLQLDVSQPDVSFLWNNNNTNATQTIASSGTYWVKAYNQCATDYDTIIVNTARPLTVALPSDTTICENASIVLAVSNDFASYLWSSGENTPSISVNKSGMYKIYVTNACGAATDSILVSIEKIPQVNIPSTINFCKDSYATVNAAFSGASYIWSDGNTDSVVQITQAGKYWVTISTKHCSNTFNFDVARHTYPDIDIGNDTTICIDSSFWLNAEWQYANYLWHDGSTNAMYKVENEGVYYVKVSNICGVMLDEISVSMRDCSSMISIANVFTPNNDNKNDMLYIEHRNIIWFECYIYDRWGLKMYTYNNLDDQWNGSYHGHPVTDGTYYYSIKAKGSDGKEYQKTGTVEIIR